MKLLLLPLLLQIAPSAPSALTIVHGPIVPPAASYTATTATNSSSSRISLSSSGPTGLSDSKQVTASLWIQNSTPGTYWRAIAFSADRFLIDRSGTTVARIIARNSSGTTIASLTFDCDFGDGTVWRHLLIDVDTSNSSNCRVWVDGSEVTVTGTPTDELIDLVRSGTSYTAFGNSNGSNPLIGSLADVWIASGVLETDVTKFRNPSTGKPVDLGSDGSGVNGTAPPFFLKGSGNDFNNAGQAGSFTRTGELGTTTPP